jgi:hypothetical protein
MQMLILRIEESKIQISRKITGFSLGYFAAPSAKL